MSAFNNISFIPTHPPSRDRSITVSSASTRLTRRSFFVRSTATLIVAHSSHRLSHPTMPQPRTFCSSWVSASSLAHHFSTSRSSRRVSSSFPSSSRFAFFVVITPLQTHVMKVLFKVRLKAMVWTDQRARLLSELLNGMKLIKFFGAFSFLLSLLLPCRASLFLKKLNHLFFFVFP